MYYTAQYLELKNELNALGEEEFASFSSKLTPNAGSVIGVRMPFLRKIAKKLSRDYFGYKELFDEKVYEERVLLGLSLAYSKIDGAALYNEVRAVSNIFKTWAEVDSFCNTVKRKDEELYDLALELINSNGEFVNRTGIILLMTHFLDAKHIDDVLTGLAAVSTDKYYVRMAIAWTFATAYINYPDRVYELIKNSLPDPITAKMTIRKCLDSYRISKEEKQRLRSI